MPQVRPEKKNQARSSTIGPPNEPLKSRSDWIAFASDRPWSRSDWSKLSLCRLCDEYDVRNEPAKSLPPSRGIRFVRTPPDSVSAEMPLSSKTNSWISSGSTLRRPCVPEPAMVIGAPSNCIE